VETSQGIFFYNRGTLIKFHVEELKRIYDKYLIGIEDMTEIPIDMEDTPIKIYFDPVQTHNMWISLPCLKYKIIDVIILYKSINANFYRGQQKERLQEED
ncbi:hypothetical protein ACJX0J_008816, partial [Zea mays]